MRVVIQRVAGADVSVEGRSVGRIGRGLLVLVGMTHADGSDQLRWMCEKILRLRLFEDDQGKMNLSVEDVGGGILLVPQFTLYGDARKGNRPGFSEAARPEAAEPLFAEMVAVLKGLARGPVESGSFRAHMKVALVNDGPVTILIER